MNSRFFVFFSWPGSVRAFDLTSLDGGRLVLFFLLMREEEEEVDDLVFLESEEEGFALAPLVGAISLRCELALRSGIVNFVDSRETDAWQGSSSVPRIEL